MPPFPRGFLRGFAPGIWHSRAMLLTDAELHSLVNAQIRSPHTLLGMHPLGDESGVVVRAYLPNAAAVEVVPVHERDLPVIKLKRLHESGLYEGVTTKAHRVYAYDLIVTEYQGAQRR